jgi:hypothetical protein
MRSDPFVDFPDSERAAAAYYEAGHAVARLHFGWPATEIEIDRSCADLAHGTDCRYRLNENRARELLVCLFAGTYAEASGCNQRLTETFQTSGVRDLELSVEVMIWLTGCRPGRTQRSVLHRAHRETTTLLSSHWDSVERLADRLIGRGRLTARQVKAAVQISIQSGG